MCVVSMVYDHYSPLFPQSPNVNPGTIKFYPTESSEVAELRQLIKEFREALEAAKKVDLLTGQPDCEDPKKKTLEERVAALEKIINASN